MNSPNENIFFNGKIMRGRNKCKGVFIFIIAFILMMVTFTITFRNYNNRNLKIVIGNNKLIKQNSIESVSGFSLLNNNVRGPITLNKELDDGSKSNIYSLLIDTVPERKEELEEVTDKEEIYYSSQQRVAIVMYSDSVESNSLTEHAISEFYQYSNIHGYKFLFYNQRYDKERESFYMKIHSLIEAVSLGLEEKEFEWVMWVDGDVILANPNIKLQTFLPTDPNVHFIAADRDGLNAGVFFVRVNSWSLNYLIRVLSYPYFRNETYLKYTEEASLNNVLIEYNEDKHYVIVPHHWFNTYPDQRDPGDFLLHFCYRKIQGGDSKKVREEVRNDPNYLSAKTNEELRKEVLKYYKSKRKQLKISLRTS